MDEQLLQEMQSKADDRLMPCRRWCLCESTCVCVLSHWLTSWKRCVPCRCSRSRVRPSYVDGVAMIRGEPVPVVRLARLLKMDQAAEPARLVVVRTGRGRVALGVDGVIGVRSLKAATIQSVPPLLADASELIAGLGSLDRELLIVLQASRILPDEVWNSIEAGQARPHERDD